jgi:hypothetical protein
MGKSVSVAIPSLAIDRLSLKAGVRRRKRKRRRGDPYPLESTRSGGGKKSKRKGASFESVIARAFAIYYGCSVRRTPGSGGWATVGDFGPRGDLVFATRKAPYHVECKKHEGWDLSDLITGVRGRDTTSTNSIEQWWGQCIRDCPRKKIPMLIFARNRQKVGRAESVGVPPLLIIRFADLVQLERMSRKPKDPWKGPWHVDFMPMLSVKTELDEGRVIVTLADFFRFVRPPYKSPRWKAWKRKKETV